MTKEEFDFNKMYGGYRLHNGVDLLPEVYPLPVPELYNRGQQRIGNQLLLESKFNEEIVEFANKINEPLIKEGENLIEAHSRWDNIRQGIYNNINKIMQQERQKSLEERQKEWDERYKNEMNFQEEDKYGIPRRPSEELDQMVEDLQKPQKKPSELLEDLKKKEITLEDYFKQHPRVRLIDEEGQTDYINTLIKSSGTDTNLISDGHHTFGELYKELGHVKLVLKELLERIPE